MRRIQFILVLLFRVCHGIQKFEETPQYTEVNPGQDAKLVCRVLAKQGQCIWQKDQKPIGMHLKKYEWVGSPDLGDCSLWVRSATLDFDDGLWQCQVTASDFTTQDALTSEPARLVVRVSPQRPQIEYAGAAILPGSNVTARVGEIATLTCTARYGNPSPLIKWYIGETELRTLRPQVNATEIDNPRTWSTKSVCDILAQRARYGHPIRCVAIHPAYSSPTMSSSTEVRFDVRYAPKTHLVGTPNGQLEEGRDHLEIRCIADANPTASILWKRTKGSDVMEVASIGETLKFSPIFRNHAAVYICVASNTEGESDPVSTQITVNYPPKIISVGPDRLSTALLYSGASFECHADAMPSAEYRWAQVFNDGRAPVECGMGQRLILTNVTYAQQGQYICLASNKINGNLREVKSTPVSLQVVGAPRVVKPTSSEKFVVSTTEGSPARLEIRLCSDPKPRLVAWEWGSTRLHAGEVLESRYRALDLELASEDCYIAILEFTHTVKEDQRLYYVIVENDHGSDRRALMLRVDEPAQIPLVIGAVAGFTVLSILIMGFVCFLRSDRCCVPTNTGPTLQQVHCTKASNAMIEDPRLPGVDTMERAAQQFVQEKRHNNHVLKPVATQYPQDCYQHEAHPQSHYQRHHHPSQPPPLHGPQYTLQRRNSSKRISSKSFLADWHRKNLENSGISVIRRHRPTSACCKFSPLGSFTALRISATVTSLEGRAHNFWRQRASTVPHTLLVLARDRTTLTTKAIMPARKGAKRTAAAPAKGVKPAKIIKKKDELSLRPDLRRIENGGYVLAVGQGDVGQLGLGTQYMEKMRPAPIPECKDVVSIAAGGMHSVCLTKAGTILTFGCNDEGALGRDTSVEDSETTPGLVKLDGTAVQVTAGDSHSAALLNDGRVFAWGSFRDSHGNMGLTAKGNERTPVQMLPSHKVVKIASGSDHLVFLTDAGRVYTCGCAEQGQLGRVCSRSVDRHSRRGVLPLLTPSLVLFNRSKNLRVEEIWAGSYCTFAKIYSKEEIHVFGLNNYHQLGLEDTGTYSFPSKSQTFDGRKWKHITSGQHHTLALEESGQVYVLGRKEYGRLGLGESCEDAKELTVVPSFAKMKCVDVATGSAQSFAVTESGDLYAWGMGSNGQLGTGAEEDVQVPVVIKSNAWIKENRFACRVVGGGQHTLILATNSSTKSA